MKSMNILALAAISLCMGTAAQAADTLTYNASPVWHFGTGNDYNPGNTARLITDAGDEIILRMHQTGQFAPASDNNGVYDFGLGTTPMSADWGIKTSDTSFSAVLTFTNMGTGASFSYNPLFIINDNSVVGNSRQNSYRLNSAPGLGYNPAVANTYKVNLTLNNVAGGPKSLDVYARLGAAVGVVPEPASWAMMISGFGLVGGAMRRKASTRLPALA